MIKKFLLILLCICLFTATVSAASDEISSLEAEVEVDSSGTCFVSLTLQVQFSSTAKEFLIPLGTEAYEVHASAAFETDTCDGVEYAVFQNEFGFSGKQSFTCSYYLPCTMTESETAQNFALQLPERGFALPIQKYKLTVRFPVEVTELPTWTSSYYQDVIDNYLNIKVTENVVTASSNIEFRDHETVTMKLGFAPESFDLRHLSGQTAGVAKLGFALLAGVSILYWILRLRSKGLRIRPLQAVNLDSGAGELPCQLHGLSPDIASLLAHWGNLGYVVICKDRRGHLFLQKNPYMDMGNERKPAEQRLFQALFSRSSRCDIPSGRFAAAVKREGEGLRISWMQRMFRKESGNPQVLRTLALLAGAFISVLCFDLLLAAKPSRWFWLVVLSLLGAFLCYLTQQVVYAFSRRDGTLRLAMGIVAAVLLLLLSWKAECALFMVLSLSLQIFCAYVTRYGGRRNEPGEELLREILGLRRFLRKADNDVAKHLLTADSQYFYKMLPYAEMMGVGRTFVRRFGAGGTEPCRWLICEKRKPKTASEFYTLYCEIMAELRRAQKPSKLLGILGVLLGTARPQGRGTEKDRRARRPVPQRGDRPARPSSKEGMADGGNDRGGTQFAGTRKNRE